ncbi:MAG: MATE family efflux transporter, partial [Clostridia bacterium]
LGRLSFPVFLGKFVFCLGKVIVNALARNYGNQAPGALGVSNQLGGSVTNITGSIEESSSVIISQNVAVHNKKRVIDAFWKSFIVNMAISIVGVMLLVILNSQIIGFFSNDDKVYADLISRIFFWERLGIIPLAITASVTGLIYGLGYTKLGMWLNLSRLFVFRIPPILIMMYCFPQLDAECLGIAMFISNTAIGITSAIIAICLLVKLHKTDMKDSVNI